MYAACLHHLTPLSARCKGLVRHTGGSAAFAAAAQAQDNRSRTWKQSWAQVLQSSPASQLPSPQNGPDCSLAAAMLATRWLEAAVRAGAGGDGFAVTLFSSVFCSKNAPNSVLPLVKGYHCHVSRFAGSSSASPRHRHRLGGVQRDRHLVWSQTACVSRGRTVCSANTTSTRCLAALNLEAAVAAASAAGKQQVATTAARLNN